MSMALVGTYLRQRAASPMRLVMFGVLTLFTVGACVAMRDPGPLAGVAVYLALLVASGAIGQDVSSGVLQLTLSRPLTRREYVLSRWLASALGATALFALMWAMALAGIAARGGTMNAAAFAVQFGEGVAAAFGVSAVMVALSAMVPGLGDLAIWFVATTSAAIAQQAGPLTGRPWVTRAGHELALTLSPALPLDGLRGEPVSWALVAAYFSTVTLALAVAVWFTNRRELSYANG